MTDQPLCRDCNNVASFNVGGVLLCPEHTFSEIARGSASLGDEVTAPADLPPNSMPGSFTDSHTNTFRVAANNETHVSASSSDMGFLFADRLGSVPNSKGRGHE